MKKILRFVIPVVILGVGALAVFWSVSDDDSDSPVAEVVPENFALVTSTAPEIQSLSPQLLSWGEITAPNSAQLSASVGSARIEQVLVNLGDRVNAGQPLIELDTSDLALQAEQLQAQIDELAAQQQAVRNKLAIDEQALELEQAQLSVAETEVRRLTRLAQQGLASDSQLEQAQNQLRASQIAVNNRQLAVNNAETDLLRFRAQSRRLNSQAQGIAEDIADSTITAPFEGRVASLNAKVGERAGTAALAQVVGDDRKLSTWIPAKYANSDLEGMIWLDGESFVASRVNKGVAANAGSIETELVLAGNDSLTPGRYAQAVLSLPAVDAVALPAAAIYGSGLVYQISEGQLYPSEVNIIGRRMNDGDEWVLIDPLGIKFEDRVLVTRLDEAAPGLRVKEVQ
ncbi:efflux RND transporter periplasmic adaptor subunit [Salinibius halmophilus]|uniref:efflux RND transporter periplasmic adaptor subunit n=1 Tax=Salinibius halmophilus TaxID=1853216 RepID=UPI0013142FDA|nr:biotin/lipoyl-binding protein [Salinibius halmophilus]